MTSEDHLARNATLKTDLKAKTGFRSHGTFKVSVDQWTRINAILNEPDPTEVPAPAPEQG